MRTLPQAPPQHQQKSELHKLWLLADSILQAKSALCSHSCLLQTLCSLHCFICAAGEQKRSGGHLKAQLQGLSMWPGAGGRAVGANSLARTLQWVECQGAGKGRVSLSLASYREVSGRLNKIHRTLIFTPILHIFLNSLIAFNIS